MKIARFLYKRKIFWGKLANDFIIFLRHEPYTKVVLTSQKVPLSEVKLLPPATPTKIILVGLNYRDHAQELKMKIPQQPVIFLKPNTTLIGPGDKIIYPKIVKRLDYEAELAIVMGRKARFIKQGEATRYILGYCCLNDVTARELQKQDIQWTRSKSFDSFCPLGPWLETDLKPQNLKIKLYLNGELKQDSSTANFIFPVGYLIWFIAQIMTLSPGDIISTGTPPGVGMMKRGDTVEVDVEGIGRLKNCVA